MKVSYEWCLVCHVVISPEINLSSSENSRQSESCCFRVSLEINAVEMPRFCTEFKNIVPYNIVRDLEAWWRHILLSVRFFSEPCLNIDGQLS